jgi:RNA polymerase sigma-70 factor (ECF subfamily)
MSTESREEKLRSLMCAGLDGDADAYRRLLLELSSHLRGYFRSRLLRFHRGDIEAEDLVQEVLMAVHTRRDTYDRSQLLTPWVHAIARYKFLDYLRRTKTSVKDVPADDAAHLTAHNEIEGVESGYDLETLLAQLRPKARRAIRYVKLQGLSVREAALRTGMSESAVKVSVHRGLKALSALVKKGEKP